MAETRHKRDTNARRTTRTVLVAAPLAVVATASALTLGVVLSGAGSSQESADTADQASLSVAARELDPAREESNATRTPVVSRSQARALGPKQGVEKLPNLTSKKATRAAIRSADTQLWTTDELNLWTSPGEKAEEVGELDTADKILVTGRTMWGREEVVVKGQPLWVTAGYLSADKPVGAGAGLSMDPCPDTSVENGLTDRAVYVYRSVCHAFPAITSYGGYDNHGEHASGRALDIMTSDVTLGTAIADFLRTHAAELDLYDVIWRQRIYTQQRGGEGWRSMSNRGSATANHFDHVHVSTY